LNYGSPPGTSTKTPISNFCYCRRRGANAINNLSDITITITISVSSFIMCFGSRDDVEVKRSREIDTMIHRDEKNMQRQVKLLLLGEQFLFQHSTNQPIDHSEAEYWLITMISQVLEKVVNRQF
jgi:hypothetical protein